MKKKIFIFSLLLSLICFTSCDALFADLSSDSNTKSPQFVTVSGSLSFEGAVPEQFVNEEFSNAKTAMPSIDIATYAVTIKTESGDSVPVTVTNSTKKFSASLQVDVNYTIDVTAKNSSGKVVAAGSYKNGASSYYKIPSEGTAPALSVVIAPTTADKGKVDLTINIPDDTLKSYKMEWVQNVSGVPFDKTYGDHSVAYLSGPINFHLTDSNVEADVESGYYDVRFSFYTDTDSKNCVLSFVERVNVFDNLTTNKFVNNGSSTFIDADGKISITSSSVQHRNVFYVKYKASPESDDLFNTGSYFKPYTDLQTAINFCIENNKSRNENYTIYLKDDYKLAASAYSNQVIANIDNTGSDVKPLKLTICSPEGSVYSINGNVNNCALFNVQGKSDAKVELTLSNLGLTNCKFSDDSDTVYAINAGANSKVILKKASISVFNSKSSAAVCLKGTSATNKAELVISDNSSIFNNTYTGSGGAIYAEYADIEMESGTIGGSSFTEANNSQNGGAVYLSSGSILKITGGSIKNNVAQNGGAVYLEDNADSQLIISGGEISNNHCIGLVGSVTTSHGVYAGKGNSITLSSDAKFGTSDVIYLKDNQTIKVSGTLSETDVATVLVSDEADGRIVLTGDAASNYTKFAYDNSNYSIGSDGKLQQDYSHICYVDQTSGDDSNAGTKTSPKKNLSTAINAFVTANDGGPYTIYLKSDVIEGTPSDSNFIKIDNSSGSSELNIKIMSDSSTVRKITANRNSTTNGSVFDISGKTYPAAAVKLEFENIEISGGYQTLNEGEQISLNGQAYVTIENNCKIISTSTTKSAVRLNYSTSNIYLKDNAYIDAPIGIFLGPNTNGIIKLKYDLTPPSAGVPNATVTKSGGVIGSVILKGDSSLSDVEQTAIVASNYERFKYVDSSFEIDSDGKLKSGAVSIASIATTAGKTMPDITINVPAGVTNFTLSTDAELRQLSKWVEGSETFAGCTFKLTDDITMGASNFTPIGSSSNPFFGLFDGNGKTIENLTISEAGSDVGLFGYVQDGAVENLTVKGTVSGSAQVAGIVGVMKKTAYATLSNAGCISNCVNYADVTSTLNDGGSTRSGGICGRLYSGTIENCVNFGTVNGYNRSVGGICGTFEGNANITYCVNFGTVTSTNVQAGGIAGFTYETGTNTVSNCYNTGDVSGTSCGFILGSATNKNATACYYTNTGTDGSSVGDRKTVAEINSLFASWTNTVTISGTSYKVPVACEAPAVPSTPSIASLATAAGTTLPDSTWTIPAGVTEFTLESDPELRQLSLWASANNLSGYTFKLTNNITMTSSDFTPIGTSSKYFAGTFDGNGKTISNIIVNKNSSYSGLFGRVRNALISDLTIEVSVNGNGYTGGLVGNAEGTSRIENIIVKGSVSGYAYTGGIAGNITKNASSVGIINCVSYADVTSTPTTGSNSRVGGICGNTTKAEIQNCVNFGSIKGSMTDIGGIAGTTSEGAVKNCVNFGSVSNTSTTAANVGGVIGECYNDTDSVSDCYNAGDVTVSGSNAHGFVAGTISKGSFTGLYYTNTGTNGNTGGTYKTVTEVNALTPFSTWTNTVTVNGTTYKVPVACEAPAPAVVSGVVADCASKPPAGEYTLSTQGELEKIADWVANSSDGLAGYTFKLSSNTSVTTLTPIGTNTKPFKGTFDGDNNYITYVTINMPSTDYVGLFGVIEGPAEIKNVKVTGTINGGDVTGGVCGWNNGGTITGCFSSANVTGTTEVGGICGKNNVSSTISRCINVNLYSSIEASDSIVGGIVGSNGGTVSDCLNICAIKGKSFVGGICGESTGGTIENCLASGTVTKTDAYVYTVGLIAGTKNTITNCYYVSATENSGCGSAGGALTDAAAGCTRSESGASSYTSLRTSLGSNWNNTRTYSDGTATYPSPIP